MKRSYELTVVYAPVLKEEGLKSAKNTVEALAKKMGGSVSAVTEEGKQALAYPLKKFGEGIYVFFVLELPTDKTGKFEEELMRQKGVIRQLLVKGEE